MGNIKREEECVVNERANFDFCPRRIVRSQNAVKLFATISGDGTIETLRYYEELDGGFCGNSLVNYKNN